MPAILGQGSAQRSCQSAADGTHPPPQAPGSRGQGLWPRQCLSWVEKHFLLAVEHAVIRPRTGMVTAQVHGYWWKHPGIAGVDTCDVNTTGSALGAARKYRPHPPTAA